MLPLFLRHHDKIESPGAQTPGLADGSSTSVACATGKQPSTEQVTSQESSPPALSLTSLRKRFGDQVALDGLSLDVPSGQRVALLGPNGAGKTTLVRAIAGRVRLDAGQVNLLGRPIEEPGAGDHLGVVPQELAIYGDLTARENLTVFAQMHGLMRSEIRQRVDWALQWIGLTDRQHQLTRTFSGGMKRRVNIACGVLHRPKLLLLDEPTVGVDPQSRQRIFEMLDSLHRSGTTLMLTTHHLDEAQSQCDRIVIVDHGRVVADGPLDELIEKTLGNYRRVNLQLKHWTAGRLEGLVWDPNAECWVAGLGDIGEDLPILLNEIRALGGYVNSLEIREPNLHELFLTLTGCELRE
ncbi:MAG: ABC transporter ATP-binding protein [Pirellulaceae bacterium]|nr:ABC transporter ATP-binding protein [Pirellulaceae bacterium]